VPAGIARIFGRGKSHGKGAHAAAGLPPARADEQVEGIVQKRGVRGFNERLLRVHTEPNNGLRPRRRIVRITSGIPPENRAGLFCEFA
jgi:hypothetical protein